MSLCAVISVASRSMTSQPASSFPAIRSHGNPAGVAAALDPIGGLPGGDVYVGVSVHPAGDSAYFSACLYDGHSHPF